MALEPFVAAADFAADYLGRDYADENEQTRATRLLRSASAKIREAAGWQQISKVEDDVVALRAIGCDFKLPQRPVLGLAAVDGLSSQYWTLAGTVVRRIDGNAWTGMVTVIYSHGYETDDPAYELAAGICGDMVKRVLDNPDGNRSESETIGSFSHSETKSGDTPGALALLDTELRQIQSAFGVNIGTMSIA